SSAEVLLCYGPQRNNHEQRSKRREHDSRFWAEMQHAIARRNQHWPKAEESFGYSLDVHERRASLKRDKSPLPLCTTDRNTTTSPDRTRWCSGERSCSHTEERQQLSMRQIEILSGCVPDARGGAGDTILWDPRAAS